MSNILTKTVKKGKLLSIIAAIVLAVATVVGVVFGAMGMGVFNKDELLKDTKTVTVSVSQFVFQSEEHLEVLENACDEALEGVDVVYELKGEMFGATCELVYVFASDADLTAAKAALEAKAEALTAQGGALEGFDVTIGSNSEAAIGVLAQGYIWRGIVAGVVLVVLVFVYVAIRHGLYMGIVSAASTALGTLLTAALFILTRIPVTASVTYVLAASALLTAVTSVMALNKIRANVANAEEGQTAEEVIGSSYATKEIVTFTALAGVSLVIFGAVATEGVRWFAILALIALLVAACVGLVYVPALYLPFKEKLDKKPVEGAYVGAEKTSTKVKKVFEKKQPVKEEVKAAPVAEEPAAEEVAEETTEEVVEETEETVEEAAQEEVVEETETAEEALEEAPVEEAVEEVPVEETEEK